MTRTRLITKGAEEILLVTSFAKASFYAKQTTDNGMLLLWFGNRICKIRKVR